MIIWYTRDDSGERALWSKKPEKFGGEWATSKHFLNDDIIGADFNFVGEVDKILGEGVHGLRKGRCRKISLKWHYMEEN